MRLQLRLLRGDGVEHACDAVRDVVAHYIFYKEHRQPDADDREDEVEPVGSVCHKAIGEQILYQSDEFMKKVCR